MIDQVCLEGPMMCRHAVSTRFASGQSEAIVRVPILRDSAWHTCEDKINCMGRVNPGFLSHAAFVSCRHEHSRHHTTRAHTHTDTPFFGTPEVKKDNTHYDNDDDDDETTTTTTISDKR